MMYDNPKDLTEMVENLKKSIKTSFNTEDAIRTKLIKMLEVATCALDNIKQYSTSEQSAKEKAAIALQEVDALSEELLNLYIQRISELVSKQADKDSP